MIWYAAHVVMVLELKDRTAQEHFPVWENIYLVEAETVEQAYAEAERLGREQEGDDDDSLTWQERPARWRLAGVRKLTECLVSNNRPGHGDEVTYTDLQFDSLEAVEQFARGESVKARIEDPFPKPAIEPDPVP